MSGKAHTPPCGAGLHLTEREMRLILDLLFAPLAEDPGERDQETARCLRAKLARALEDMG